MQKQMQAKAARRARAATRRAAGAAGEQARATIRSGAEARRRQGREDGPLREIGGVAERARRVMEELRRRLADPNRPVDERDYLERLMKRD